MIDEAFTRLSKTEQRVAIAKDVLKQLEAKKIVATSGCYVSLEDHDPDLEVHLDDQLSELFPKAGLCGVCALGSLFVSMVTKLNACTAKEVDFCSVNGDIALRGSPYKYLTQLFDIDALHEIENAFEGWNDWSYEVEDYDGERQTFNLIPGDDDERLRVIMQNIVGNSGDFLLTPDQFDARTD